MEALATMVVALECGEGWAMVVGQEGSGKCEVIEWLMANLPEGTTPVLISAQGIEASMDLLRQIADGLGLPECNYKSRFLIDLREYLETCHRQDQKVLLVIKDAHLLDEELLQELDLLGNSDYFSPRVLNIFLFAHPQILDTLEHMGATNLKHHLRRFRRLERRMVARPYTVDRRRSERAFEPIDYSVTTGNGLPIATAMERAPFSANKGGS